MEQLVSMGKTILFVLFALMIIRVDLLAQNLYSKSEVTDDLSFLKTELIKNHPNLYTYITEQELDNWFDRQKVALSDSLDKLAAFKVVSSISPLLKDGHSYIYPSAQHLDAFYQSAPLFPLDVFMMNDNLYVTGNFSKEQNIPLGSILKKVNGVEIEKIQSLIVGHICRDGDNMQYAKHLYYQFFPAYYSFFFGFEDNFEIEYLNESGDMVKVAIQGLKRNAMKEIRSSVSGTGISLNILEDSKAAILTIQSFDKSILKDVYNQKFKSEIKKIFKVIADKNIGYLAIDLRDNQGGALSNGIYLLNHVMDSSFQCVHSYYKMKNGKRKKLNTKWDNFFKPKSKNHFSGKIYMFINGGSFSCSAIVANTIKRNSRGQIIGEMSGGSAYVNSGAPNIELILPNTKIIFTIPKTQYLLRKDLKEIKSGVIPDISVIDHPNRKTGGSDHFIEKFREQLR